jgi:hypothetical protein
MRIPLSLTVCILFVAGIFTAALAAYYFEGYGTWAGYFDPERTGSAGGTWSANPPDPYSGGHLVSGH